MNQFPNLEQLAGGRLHLLSEGDPGYAGAKASMQPRGIRLASAATWIAWRRFRWVELREAVALQLYLDPDTLPPAFGARWRPGVTISGLFGQRLRLAVRHALHESLPCLELAEDFTRARVTLWDFAAWADDLEVPCPPDFPRADPKPAAPSARRARTDPGFLRQADLLASVVPFSAATLWRKVKKGTFPRPIKLSEGVTAWSQHDVKHWIEERAQASAKKKPRNRK